MEISVVSKAQCFLWNVIRAPGRPKKLKLWHLVVVCTVLEREGIFKNFVFCLHVVKCCSSGKTSSQLKLENNEIFSSYLRANSVLTKYYSSQF